MAALAPRQLSSSFGDEVKDAEPEEAAQENAQVDGDVTVQGDEA